MKFIIILLILAILIVLSVSYLFSKQEITSENTNLFEILKDWQRGNLLGGISRSKDWNKVRKEFLRKNPLCAVCGKKGKFLKANEIHHILPFHKNPELELKKENLITLCREDHLTFGHLKSFKSYNPNIDQDSKIWRKKIENRL